MRSLFILASRVVKEVPIQFAEQYNEARRQDHIQHVYEVIPFDQNEQMYEIAKIATISEFLIFLDTHPYACNVYRLLEGIVKGDNTALFEYVIREIFDVDLYVPYSLDESNVSLGYLQKSHTIWEDYVLPHLNISGVEYKMYYDVNLSICTYVCVIDNNIYSNIVLDNNIFNNAIFTILTSGSVELFKDEYVNNEERKNYVFDVHLGQTAVGGRKEIIDYIYKLMIQRHGYLSREAIANFLCGAALSNDVELFRHCWKLFSESSIKYLGGDDDPKFIGVKFKDFTQVSIEFSSDLGEGAPTVEQMIFNTCCHYGTCNTINEMLRLNPNLIVSEGAVISKVSPDLFEWIVNLNNKNGGKHFNMKIYRHLWDSTIFVNNILMLNRITGKTFNGIKLNPMTDAHIIEVFRRYPRLIKSDIELEEDYYDIVDDNRAVFVKAGNVDAFSLYYRIIARRIAEHEKEQEYDEEGEPIEKIITEEDIADSVNGFLGIAIENCATDIVEYMIVNNLVIDYSDSFLGSSKLMNRTIDKLSL